MDQTWNKRISLEPQANIIKERANEQDSQCSDWGKSQLYKNVDVLSISEQARNIGQLIDSFSSDFYTAVFGNIISISDDVARRKCMLLFNKGKAISSEASSFFRREQADELSKEVERQRDLLALLEMEYADLKKERDDLFKINGKIFKVNATIS